MTQLCVNSLSLIAGRKTLCHNLSLTIAQGECWGLLGRNGAGKTSLLKCLAGIIKPEEGCISLDSVPMRNYGRNHLALRIGMLFQEGLSGLPATVFETVLLGRHPYNESLLRDSQRDIQIVEDILDEVELSALKERELDTLSGGELQKVGIALLLAQDPDVFLLDEPSNHLDIAFKTRLKTILKNRVAKKSASLLLATHDINYINQFCDKLILLLENGSFIIGETRDILTEENLSAAFSSKISKFSNGRSVVFYPC